MSFALATEPPILCRSAGPESRFTWRFWAKGLVVLNVAVLLVVAAGLRLWQLDRLPGINGDEAWYGVLALRWLRGESIGWRTPTGNLLNPFFIVPLIGLHRCWEPSIALLRVPAVASGLLACAANFSLCRRVFDPRTAVISTVLLAVLPINLAYSRFAWDASQSLLFTVLVLYVAYWRPSARGLVAGIIALVAAVWVHPTNVFAAPAALVPWAYDHRAALVRPLRGAWLKYQDRLILLGGLLVGLGLMAAPGRGLAFLLNYLRLLSGASVYRFISGALPDTVELPGPLDIDAFDLVTVLMLAPALYGFTQLLRQRRQRVDICLACSLAAMLVGFFIVAGPAALQPHSERYGIVLIAPAVLMVARGVVWWLSAAPRHGVTIQLAAATGAWLLLATFWVDYVRYFEVSGGNSHLTFRTARVEPKVQALKIIQAESAASPTTWIMADSWWLQWPLRYLAGRDTRLHIVDSSHLPPDLRDADLWRVHFVDEAEPAHRPLPTANLVLERHSVKDQQGRPLIALERLSPKRLRPQPSNSLGNRNFQGIHQECGYPLRREFDNLAN